MQADANLTITTTVSYFQLSQAAFKGKRSFTAPREEVQGHNFLAQWSNYTEHLTNSRPLPHQPGSRQSFRGKGKSVESGSKSWM